MKKFKLIPTRGQKSFYGKAWVIITDDGETILRSYTTDVCKIDAAGRFVRLWDGYSVTTMNHINSFIETFKIDGGGKKWWLSLPCENTAVEHYKIEYGNGFFNRTLSIVFDNYDDASAEAERIEKLYGGRRYIYAEVIEA